MQDLEIEMCTIVYRCFHTVTSHCICLGAMQNCILHLRDHNLYIFAVRPKELKSCGKHTKLMWWQKEKWSVKRWFQQIPATLQHIFHADSQKLLFSTCWTMRTPQRSTWSRTVQLFSHGLCQPCLEVFSLFNWVWCVNDMNDPEIKAGMISIPLTHHLWSRVKLS